MAPLARIKTRVPPDMHVRATAVCALSVHARQQAVKCIVKCSKNGILKCNMHARIAE